MTVALTQGQLEAKDKLIAKLRELRQYTDGEYAHVEADMALLNFIERVTGDMKVSSAYLALDRWYA